MFPGWGLSIIVWLLMVLVEGITTSPYNRILHPIRRRVVDLISKVEPEVLNALATADYFLQERSAIALEATAMNIAAGSLIIPSLIQYSEMPADLWVPTNEDATPVARNGEQMRDLISKFAFDSDFNENLRSHRLLYKQDGKAASRVAVK